MSSGITPTSPDEILEIDWDITGAIDEWAGNKGNKLETRIYGTEKDCGVHYKDSDVQYLEPRRFLERSGAAIPYEVFYETIVHTSSAEYDGTCRNSDTVGFLGSDLKTLEKHLETLHRYRQDQILYSTYVEEFDRMGIIHDLFWCTRSTLIRNCGCKPVTPFRHLIPRCPTWPGLETWISQLLACGLTKVDEGVSEEPQRQGPSYLSSIAMDIKNLIQNCNAIHSHDMLDEHSKLEFGCSVDPQYRCWESTVDLVEVFDLCSWFVGVVLGSYEFLFPTNGFQSRQLDVQVVNAMERADQLSLCPQRVWNLAANLPGQQLCLPMLVPSVSPESTHWRQVGHDSCTPDFCGYSIRDFTFVEQLHVCSVRELCSKTDHLFPQQALMEAVKLQDQYPGSYIPTAWALDGLSIVKPNQPFMAVSHVWSDGTGTGKWTRGMVNVCVYELFCEMARELGCCGIWWDSISLPTEKVARIRALNKMHENYANAKATLVHDRYLSTFQWVEAPEACFAVVMSSWFTRGWTALELAKSRSVKVLFNNNGSPLLKDLDSDILVRDGVPSYPYHYLATRLVIGLRKGIENLNGLLTVLGPRYTSWPRDKPIIAGLLVGIPDPASMTQNEAYQAVVKSVLNISIGNMFHGMTLTKGGFGWCPTDLFKMPIGDSANQLQVMSNGDLIGEWDIRCLKKCEGQIEILSEGNHPLIRAKLDLALADPRRHVLLLSEPNNVRWARGFVVRLRSGILNLDFKSEALPCELVGAVKLRWVGSSIPLEKEWGVKVRISDLSNEPELPTEANACSTLMQHWRNYYCTQDGCDQGFP